MCELPTLLLIKETNKQIRVAFDEHFASTSPNGPRPQERHLLFYLSNHPEATSADLQSFQCRSKSSISESLSALEEGGYIELVNCEEDRRKKHICITDLGRSIIEDTQNRAKAFDQTLLEGVNAEEEAVLRKALERIIANAERSKNGQ